ncbi:photosystem II reaction center protein Psb28 [Lusitaniella coriacea LEGE 07157]|uniref:Photosystem II reaction center Psb28 protein n=1 Tax=Lusitaniella coriacea LEGE 07157 TaxID=945747 RepID=A0A8J7JDI5_9CYAN|nr:photosystem II reaction center protein Psb28 [Lusitaniella coriacea]MBE9118300.1 photosystem II reaction center protein Psb28 [Lusitaniella coriacea LEGE 07157]
MARIEFSKGIVEEIVPDVRLTRSRNGNGGIANFRFDDPNALKSDSTEEITGMYMIDNEGEITTRDVKGVFVNGQARALEAMYVMRSAEEWERFLRFMKAYAEEQGLEFNKS